MIFEPLRDKRDWLGVVLGIVTIVATGCSHSESDRNFNPEDSWSIAAQEDLRAVRQILNENHPGAVDPQNHHFAIWLRDGYSKASDLAETAKTQADYFRALARYTNGFQDGHIVLKLNTPQEMMWPAFLTSTRNDGRTFVTAVSNVSNVSLGSEITACDNTPILNLLNERVFPFYTNNAIPQERWLDSSHLFHMYASDKRPSECEIIEDGRPKTLELNWSKIDDEAFAEYFSEATLNETEELGISTVSQVKFVHIPSFAESGETFRPFLQDVMRRRTELYAADFLVLDLRGNGGGDSSWGQKIASTLWGEGAISEIRNSFDWTVDWRASPLNIRLIQGFANEMDQEGRSDAAGWLRELAQAMNAARATGEEYYRDAQPAKGAGLNPQYVSPFVNQVFLLTDNHCASACLDFVDIVKRLPGIIHIGLATSADAIYIENVSQDLPSNRAGLSWSMKVYRNRVRGNNEWYEPDIEWQGGGMSTRAIAEWVKTLPGDSNNAQ